MPDKVPRAESYNFGETLRELARGKYGTVPPKHDGKMNQKLFDERRDDNFPKWVGVNECGVCGEDPMCYRALWNCIHSARMCWLCMERLVLMKAEEAQCPWCHSDIGSVSYEMDI